MGPIRSIVLGVFVCVLHISLTMLTACVLLCVVGAALGQSTAPTRKPAGDIEAVLSKKPHYSMLLDLLRTTGLLDELKQVNQMTLFAPTNAALSMIPDADYNALKSDTLKLRALLQYHATTDEAWHTQARANDKVFNSLDKNLPIRVNSYREVHTLAAEGVNITEANIHVANGYVHGIDGVMAPPAGDIIDIINNNPNTSILSKLLANAGLDTVIRADHNITLFAPTDAAFAKLSDEALTFLQNNPKALQETLLYHVVGKTTLYSIGMRHAMTFDTADKHHDSLMLIEDPANGDVYLNHAKVNTADISATNGVIHLLDDVLIPTSTLISIEDQGLHLG